MPDSVNYPVDERYSEQSNGTTSASVDSDGDCDNGKRLTLTTSTTLGMNFHLYDQASGSIWADNVNNAAGWIVEARLKVVSSGASGGHKLYLYDGAKVLKVEIMSDQIQVRSTYISEATQIYSHDFTDAYHKIKVSVTGTTLTIDVDDVTQISATLDASTTNKNFSFGDGDAGTGYGGVVHYDYVKYKVT